MEELELAKAAQSGDDAAFYELIYKYKVQLYKMAFMYLKNESDSLEAVQEVTFRAYTKIKKLKQPEYFKTWLIRILINYCIDEIKKQKRSANFICELKDETFNINHEKIAISQCIDTLEPKYKQIIILKYFEDLTIGDIAQILKRPEGTIKTWLNKALSKLRYIMQEGGSSCV